MTEHVKIHLKTSSREIAVEGSRVNVDELLSKWWVIGSVDQVELIKEPVAVQDSKTRRGPRRKRSAGSMQPAKNSSQTFDPQPIVNAMREDQHHDLWKTKVLHAKSAINKIKLICWYNKEYRTTGEIKAVLEGLGVKMSLSNLSNSLKDSLSDFIQDGARFKGAVVRYKMSGKAAKDFDAWLNKNE